MTSVYVTTRELNQFLNLEETVPSYRVAGAARVREEVGTGNSGTATMFWLDNASVIANTGKLYVALDTNPLSGGTALIENTDYTLDKDSGAITLTAAGTAKVLSGKIVAEYSYNSLQITDTQMQAAIDRAEDYVASMTNSTWADGGTASPNYAQVIHEKHTGKGRFDRDYYLANFPLPDVSAELKKTIGPGSATIEVDSTDGFLSAGYIAIDTEMVRYTGKNVPGTAFIGCNGTASHSASAKVTPYIIEISTTDSGTEPDWTVLKVDDDYDMDLNTGKVHIYVTEYDLTYFANQYPPNLIPDRFRATYIHGHDTIPSNVKLSVLMLASKDLMHTVARRSSMAGQAVPTLEQLNIDDQWIETTLQDLKNIKVSNI